MNRRCADSRVMSLTTCRPPGDHLLLSKPQHSMTVEELAARWQIHPKTIQRHVRANTFPIRPLVPGVRALRFAMHAIVAHEERTADV